MLLNKIPVLDEGYVALLSSALPHTSLSDVKDEFFASKSHPGLKQICYAAIAFKAPIFVQLHLAQCGLTLVGTRKTDVMAYKPNAGEIGCPDHDTNRLIADDISRTTEALLINPSAYKADGADEFISQLIMPISTYTTFIVGGTLKAWEDFYMNKSCPAPIKAYKLAIEQIMKAEWKNV